MEEFGAIVQRHGYDWRGNLREFVCAVKRRDGQMALSFGEAMGEPEEADEEAV